MEQRDVNLQDIDEVATCGTVESIRWDAEHGNWVVRIHHGSCGVVFGVDDARTHVAIITVLDLE